MSCIEVAPAPARLQTPALAARPAILILTGACLLGAGLRIAGASGSLWLDEIWSLQNLAHVAGPGDVFWGISADNNHFLNSLWLWSVGPQAPALVMRAPSILFGLSSIALAARIAYRANGWTGAGIAALMFSVSYALVQYGSEARGYAGMIFCLLWAYDALVRLVADFRDERARYAFAGASALGGLCQVTIFPAAAMLAIGACASLFRERRDVRQAGAMAARLAGAFLLGAIPAGLALWVGLLNTGAFRLGDQSAFTLAGWIDGLAGMSRATFGFPSSWPAGLVVALSAALLAVAMRMVPRTHRTFTVAAVFLLPLAEAAAHFPNPQIPRFHLASAVIALLLLSLALGAAWNRSNGARAIAIACLCAFALGNLAQLAPFFTNGRGDYAAAVRIIGNGTYATDAEPETRRVVAFFANAEGTTPSLVSLRACGDADWFIAVDDDPAPQVPPPSITRGEGPCERTFALRKSFPFAGLSGFRWSLYART